MTTRKARREREREAALLANTTEAGRKRWKVYLGVALILVGLVVATVIWLGFITEEDFNKWVILVGVVTTAIFGLAGNVLALLNPEKITPPPREEVIHRETGIPPSEQ